MIKSSILLHECLRKGILTLYNPDNIFSQFSLKSAAFKVLRVDLEALSSYNNFDPKGTANVGNSSSVTLGTKIKIMF